MQLSTYAVKPIILYWHSEGRTDALANVAKRRRPTKRLPAGSSRDVMDVNQKRSRVKS